MKIAWLTPLSVDSSIGRCSVLITNELANTADVDIWHPPARQLWQTKLRRRELAALGNVELDVFQRYDAVVYNFGNYLPFHREIFEVAQRVSGVAILHDFVLHHFFVELYVHTLKLPAAYQRAMRRYYGEEGEKVAICSLNGKQPPVWSTDSVVSFPLFEEALKRCFGVVVHSEFLRDKVKKSFAGPVTKLFLPHDVTALGTSLTRQQLGLAADRIVILTVGHVNPNKQVESVIRALGNNQDLRGRIHYVLAGPIEPKYREQLMSRAKRSGIEKDLMFVGQVSDEILHAYFRHADFCINLRYPAFESASGSLVEGLLHGKAIIVSDIGFFAEIPDDCVLKIKPQGDEQELGQAIRTLATNTSARNQLQEKAIAFAAQHFYPRRYAEEFLQFLEQARRAKPVLQAVDYVSGELGRMGVTPEMPIAGQAASIIPELFLKNTDNSKG